MNGRRKLVLKVATAVAGIVLLCTPGIANAATYQVANTQGLDLRVRSAPHLTASVIGSLPPSATIDIVCQTWGDEVNGVSAVWDKLASGGYVSDYYTTTPEIGKFSLSACASAPAPAPPPPPPPASTKPAPPAPTPPATPPPSTTPAPAKPTPAPSTTVTTFVPPGGGEGAGDLQGVNWAVPTDNYSHGALVLTGLSPVDTPATVYQHATAILQQLEAHHINTIRIPINPATVLNFSYNGPGLWWKSYDQVIAAATNLGMNVILSYWTPSLQIKTPLGTIGSLGTIENVVPTKPSDVQLGCSDPQPGQPYYEFDEMWKQVVSQYARQSNVYFEIMNEPFGYGPAWPLVAQQWLGCYSQAPRYRVIVAAAYNRGLCTGLQNWLAPVADDASLDGTLISVHFYDYDCGQNDARTLLQELGNVDPTRVVVDEFGTSVTNASKTQNPRAPASNFPDTDFNNPNGGQYVEYMRQLTAEIQSQGLGAVYWPGLKGCFDGESPCDSFSVFSLDGTKVAQRGNGSILHLLNQDWESAPAPVAAAGGAHRIARCKRLTRRQGRAKCLARARRRAHGASKRSHHAKRSRRAHRRHEAKRPGRAHRRHQAKRSERAHRRR